ncbi:TcpD family membrane protein [Streptomyces lydicus]|uniref:TcpD family membrane protein n=1 Tax=Streptomyces lydicus TaxID=47763 RepID=UPI0037B5FF8F
MTDLATALTNGADLKTWVLVIVGNVFIAVLAIRMLGHYAKREWGDMVTSFIGAVILAGIIYFPDGFITLLKTLWQKVI